MRLFSAISRFGWHLAVVLGVLGCAGAAAAAKVPGAPSDGLAATSLHVLAGLDGRQRAVLAPVAGTGRKRWVELDRAVRDQLEPQRTYIAALGADGALYRHPLVGQLVLEDGAVSRSILSGTVVDPAVLLGALSADDPLTARLVAAELASRPCADAAGALREASGRIGVDPLAGEVLLYGAQRCGGGRAAALAVLSDQGAGSPVVLAAIRILAIEGRSADASQLIRWSDDERPVIAAAALRTAAILHQRGRPGAGASTP